MIPKFRAWDKKKKKFIRLSALHIEESGENVGLVFDMSEHYISTAFSVGGGRSLNLIEGVLMQSTGLKDKNGVEIFEGDVVKVTDGESEEDSYISIVKNYSNEGYPAFDIEYPQNYHYESNVLSAIMCNGFETIEVIGNVWDNPELLEDK